MTAARRPVSANPRRRHTRARDAVPGRASFRPWCGRSASWIIGSADQSRRGAVGNQPRRSRWRSIHSERAGQAGGRSETTAIVNTILVTMVLGADAQSSPHSTSVTPMVHSAFGTRAIIGYVLLALLVAGWTLFFVLRARRRRRAHGRPPPRMTAPIKAVASERAPRLDRREARVVGWHPDPDHMSEELYWDGQSWTGRRRWSGESWVEFERGPSS
jgi:hypothetical protein